MRPLFTLLLLAFARRGAHSWRPALRAAARAAPRRSAAAAAAPRMSAAASSSSSDDDGLAVMMNGLPGAMGLEIAAACARRDGVSLAPFALTGPGMPGEVEVGGSTVELFAPDDAGKAALAEKAAAAYPRAGSLVCIDFTHPSAVNGNAAWYAEAGLPFVMGTTGGDRDALVSGAKASGGYAVIAPNMAKQIVALQAALEQMAADFPGAFDGYALSVVESHQSRKADTSGTAKAIATSLAALTNEPDFTADDFRRIERVRDRAAQLAGGGVAHAGVSPVPEAALDGHAYHTYSMTSADGEVEFQVRHNVNGRSTYAEGSVDAAVFLARQIRAEAEQRVYDMVDVLKMGGI